jgi:protein arginine N-methyltransferase 6
MSSSAKRARGSGSVSRHAPAPPDAAADPAALQAFHHHTYFESYAHLAIHQEMLRDTARTGAYREALNACGDDIRGKVVLDVGAGTGVLSSACAVARVARSRGPAPALHRGRGG